MNVGRGREMALGGRVGRGPHLGYREGQLAGSLVMDWLDATRYLNNLHNKDEAAQAWTNVLARRRGPEFGAELREEAGDVSRPTLQRARVRLDCMAMIVYNMFFAAGTQAT